MQQRTLAELGASGAERPTFDPELVAALRARAQALYARDAFDEGRVGRGEALTGAPRIRRASLPWGKLIPVNMSR